MGTETVINLLISGITLGAIYLLMAMGLTLVYGVTKVFNYAQGSFFTWGGYVAWYLSVGRLNVNYGLVIFITIVVMFFFGLIFEKIIVYPLRGQTGWDFTVIIVTLGCALLLDNLILVCFGPLSKSIPQIVEGAFHYGDYAVGKHDVITLLVAFGVLGGITLFLSKSRTGMALRAVSQDNTGAKMVGIPLDRLYTLSFGIAGGLAAIAAILLAPRTLLYPSVGWTTLMKAFVIIVFGGLGNLKGAAIASFVLAIVEVFATYLVGAIWALPIFLVLMVAILVLKPKGLFGSW